LRTASISAASAATVARLSQITGLTWTSLGEKPVLETGATVVAYLAATRISRLGGNHPLLNPTLLAIILISLGLEATRTPYEAYLHGAAAIHFMLGPAVVLLAVPLFRQRAVIRASAGLIGVGLGIGWSPECCWTRVGVWSKFANHPLSGAQIGNSRNCCRRIRADRRVADAYDCACDNDWSHGGRSRTIIARLARIDDPRVVGLTMGIASHGIGTARALQINEMAGAFAGLGMGLNGVLTASLLPFICRLL
jgi:putative effector of murein hydrolase